MFTLQSSHHFSSWVSKSFFALGVLLYTTFSTAQVEEQVNEDFPWLDTLDHGDWESNYKSNRAVVCAGKRLARLPYGLHSLEQDQLNTPNVFIAIHGYKMRGYEWPYPLTVIDNENTHTHFYRWNYHGNNEKARINFFSQLDELIEIRKVPLEKLTIVAHSCGGVMIASGMDRFPEDIDVDLHTVASPLNGLGLFTVCKPRLPDAVPENVTFTQWRTKRTQDSVYWWFLRDPQVIEMENSETIRLPPKNLGIRLGHVRSLSWVAEQLVKPDEELPNKTNVTQAD